MTVSREVFLDTAGLLGVFSARDSLHTKAAQIITHLHATSIPTVTSEWVLTEFLAAVSRPATRAAAADFVRALQQQPAVTIVHATHDDWQAAFALYSRRTDKEWSLVDCSSILTCKSRKVRRVFTHDHHFTQAGFEILL